MICHSALVNANFVLVSASKLSGFSTYERTADDLQSRHQDGSGPLWGANLRRALGKYRWGKLRRVTLQQRGLRCETCGKTETETKRIFVHEEWVYETDTDPAVARLVGLKLGCWFCHMVERFGAVTNMVRSGELFARAIDDVITHFCRLNQVERAVFDVHLADAKAEWFRLSRLNWRVDLGEFEPAAMEAQRKRQEWRDRRDKEIAEEYEDTALYEWPYLHTGEPI
jgi:hypothetical protein